jgi:tetratricopeptide (TPR) repeat protein
MNQSATAGPPPGPAVAAPGPWPGLTAYTEELKDDFFGRGEEADDLFRRVKRQLLTVLFGQSGLGKTSLLQAGLFPQLRRQDYLPVLLRLDYAAGAPDLAAQVKTALAETLRAACLPDTVLPSPDETLWEYFHRLDAELEGPAGKPVRPVLVFDQFEELFTRGQVDEAGRLRMKAFLGELADLVEDRAPATLKQRLEEAPELVERFAFDRQDYRVLLSLREDYLPHLEDFRELMPSLAQNRQRLTRLNGRQALEAVLRPGRDLVVPAVGRQIVHFVAAGKQPGLAANGAATEDDLAGLEVEPSLLNLFCRELNNRRLDQKPSPPQITPDLFAGSKEDILQDFCERCLADQPLAVRAFIEDELLTDSGFRENMALERARKVLSERGVPASALDTLVQRRLLHVEERLQVQRVELTHDVLTPVVRKSRDERQQREGIEKTRAKLRQSRRRLALVGALAVGFLALSAFAGRGWYVAVKARESANENQQQANKARQVAAFTLFRWPRPGNPYKDQSTFRRAEEALENLRDVAPDQDSYLATKTFLLDTWGLWLRDKGKYSEAKDRFEAALKIFEAALEIDRERAKINTKDLTSQLNLAVTYERFVPMYLELLDLQKAVDYQRAATKQRDKLAKEFTQYQDANNSLKQADEKLRELENTDTTKQLKDGKLAIEGELGKHDLRDSVRQKSCKIYAVKLAAGKAYWIDMIRKTEDLDPYLRLENAWGWQLAQDDDSGYEDEWGKGKLKRNARIKFKSPREGVYLIFATAYAELEAVGPFLLKIQEK